MSEDVYKPSVALYICWVVIGLLLCVILIGFLILIFMTIRQFRTTLTLKQNGLEFKKGLFNVEHKEISYNKINSVQTKIDIFGNMLGYGTIKIYTGNDQDKLIFAGVSRITDLKQKLEAKREKNQ